MPLYEYRCNSCHRRVTIIVRDTSSPVKCPHCGSTKLDRLFSSFAIRKDDKSVYDDILSDKRLVGGLERNDPRALADWNKKMTQGMDVEFDPHYQEMLDRMEAGEMPGNMTGGEEAKEE